MLDRLLTRLALLAIRRRRLILIVTAITGIAAFALGGGVVSRLGTSGFEDPASESTKAEQLLLQQFGTGEPDIVLVVRTNDGSDVDSPAAAAAGQALTARLSADPDLADVGSYWTLGAPDSLRSDDGTKALVVARTTGGEERRTEIGAAVARDYVGDDGTLTVEASGEASIYAAMSDTITKDLARAETIAIPLTLILLVFVFGSLVAAGLPLLLGLLSIGGAMLTLLVLTAVTDVSIFAMNLVTAMSLGLGIDYALFLISRYREELSRGVDPHEAVVRSVRTAGRTIIFSGLTVALAMSALLVFPLYFLRSFAYAGVAVVLLSVLGAIVVLPATLAALGRRIDKGRVLRRSTVPRDDGAWADIARRVMARPWPVLISVTSVLLLLGLPFLSASWGQGDDRALPTSSSVRQAGDIMRTEFSGRESGTLTVALPDSEQVADYAATLSTLDSVARVDSTAGVYVDGEQVVAASEATARFAAGGGSWLSVIPTVDPFSPEGEQLVRDVRETDAPGTTYVGGLAASGLDTKASLADRLPWALGIIGLSTFILLFLFTGSVVVPIKALVLNLLSLSATFGAMVWVFQEGNLSGILDFTPTGHLEMGVAILMFCIAFGLSMDYEIFLLSRIKEEYDRTGDNALAVERGLQRTGGIITAAALLLAIVFIAFATSGVSTIKLMGLGVALAILMDATLVRTLLVPAFMKLAGDWNWWAPTPFRRLHDRFGLGEGADVIALPADRPTEAAAVQ